MRGLRSVVIEVSGREITGSEIEGIKEVLRLCSGLSREELSHTVCEHLGWVTASGRHKVKACLKLLETLEEMGAIELPAKQERKKSSKKVIPQKARTTPRSELCAEMPEIGEVALKIASDKSDKSLWNEFVERYHLLGYKKPFGCRLRYFIVSKHGELGCILLSGAAKYYQGTCYRAAGWTYLGNTTGEGLRRPGREYKTTPKMLFVKPLAKDFREQLCSELKGREAGE
jgi:hypothetical protein